MGTISPNEINDEILKIWEKEKKRSTKSKFIKLPPMIYPNLKKNPDILFIGLNPSFSIKEIRRYCHGLNIDMWEYFSNRWYKTYKQDKEEFKKNVKKIEEETRKKYKYFKKITLGARTINKKLRHETIDLLFIRESNMKINQTDVINNEFFRKQLELAFKLVVQISPKQIIVMGRSARDLFLNLLSVRYLPHPSNWGKYEGIFVQECKIFRKLRFGMRMSAHPFWKIRKL